MGIWWNTRRTQHWSRVSAKEARKQTRMMRDQMERDRWTMPPTAAPAGWYPCELDQPGVTRWWDGTRWTPQTRP